MGGTDVTEYEAAFRLTEYRRKNKNFVGLAYQNMSATGPNAALPHYTPRKATAACISRDTFYVKYVLPHISLVSLGVGVEMVIWC